MSGTVTRPRLTTSYSPVHTINWLLRKYPNPFATHVFSVDTLERQIDPDTGLLRSERIIGVQQGAPKWITKVGTDGGGAREAVGEAAGGGILLSRTTRAGAGGQTKCPSHRREEAWMAFLASETQGG